MNAISKVINSTQKTESLQQLSTNTLPPYHPEVLPSFFESNGGPEMHCCCDCGDTFVCKASLTFHLQRRSVLIRFSCDSCRTIQAFYNRCSLLSHIRSHADKGEISDITKAILSPLPRVLMEGIQTDVMQNLEEEDIFQNSSLDDEAPNPTKLLELSISEVEADVCIGEEKPPLKKTGSSAPNEVQAESKKFRCSECGKEFSTAEERHDHFINEDKIPIMITMCGKCGILCPTECSSKAHKRLHLQVSPYICPECGDNPDRYWENFQKHLKYKCFHYSRSVGYKCHLCNHLFHSAESLKKHFISLHTEALFKCHVCPMAFTTLFNFHSHRRKAHANGEIPYNQLIKCALCEVVFMGKEEIDIHVVTHVKENNCQYTFSCIECGTAQDTKMSLRAHLKKSHTKTFQHHVACLNLPHEVNSVLEKNRDLGLNKSRMECILCHGSFLSRQGYSLHVTKSHSNHKYPCGICHVPSANRMEMVAHGKEHLRENIALCLLCHNKLIKPPETLEVHLLYHIERVRFQTFCPICDNTLFSFEEALQHLRAEHLLRSTIVNDSRTQEVPKKNSQDGEKSQVSQENNSLKRKADDNAKSADSSSSSQACCSNTDAKNTQKLGSSLYEKRLKTGENYCGKCIFKSTDRQEFKTHVLSHKENKSSFQCQECGLCFVVEPSLRKHLRIMHRVFDVDLYLAEEGTNHTPENEAAAEATKTNALECTVCFEVFASDTQLKTHMRSHGMAFIQAKKTSSS